MAHIICPQCPQCESSRVDYEYHPAEPDVGLMVACFDFYCNECGNSWEAAPEDVTIEEDEPDEG